MNDRQWAKELLGHIADAQRKASEDERSKAYYWNADDWGSMSGIKDAQEWVDNQVADCILKYAQPKVK